MKLFRSLIDTFMCRCFYKTYPANDFINNALGILLKDFKTNKTAIMELYYAVCAADGYFYESNAVELYKHGVDIPKKCINDTLNEYVKKINNKKAE